MKRTWFLCFFLTFPFHLLAQPITWTAISSSRLPSSVKLFQGDRTSPPLRAWYLKVDMTDTTITVRPYLSSITEGKEGVAPFTQRVGAIAAVNGGYFDVGGSTSYSAVVYPNEVKGVNVSSVVRNSVLYPVTRSFFGLSATREMGIRWIYHFGNLVRDIFSFAQPLPNAPGFPAPAPDTSQGSRYQGLVAGIGGGPTLVKNGAVNISYDPEVFWGSGVSLSTPDPRTAVGYSEDGFAILLVADGRSALSSGVSLTELAQLMVDLGCSEAMNLDGGGSSQMAVGDSLINRPEGGTFMRPVPSILAVVRAESLQVPRSPLFEKVIDTGDPACSLLGGGWFASANPGYWGPTPAMLNPRGTGNALARFGLALPAPAEYEVYGWWVASSNRATDTPFIIRHNGRADTIRVNQVQNGSQWRLLGTYFFTSDTSEAVLISNGAATGSYVVADAVRIISYSRATVGVPPAESNSPQTFVLHQNYPNPFNPATVIRYSIPATAPVRVAVYDLLGREVALLVNDQRDPGTHEVVFNAAGLGSGVYLCRLNGGAGPLTRKMLVVK